MHIRSLNRASDTTLLALRLCDLPISTQHRSLKPQLTRLLDELDEAGFRFRPHFWLSDEWFVPADVPGIAVPFYLAHPRLRKLEKKMMYEVEGGSTAQCMKILRHEAGHAIQIAYKLNRKRDWQALFGKSSTRYPEAYVPKPYSRSYVLHIDRHYAQAHPDEDFAETFAVWLAPNSNWKTRYKGWPALRKLQFVDDLMRQIAPTPPIVRSKRRVDALPSLRKTLKEHYDQRQDFYGIAQPDLYTRDLQRLFAPQPESTRGSRSAARFLGSCRNDVLKTVARWTGHYRYTLNDIYQEMIDRCEANNLRYHADADPVALQTNVSVLLAVLAMNTIREGGHAIKL